jgi:uncharacterized protein
MLLRLNAPIDCGKASSPTERAICRSYPLGQSEARMASPVAMGQRGGIDDAQRKWLMERNACGDDTTCLGRTYQYRNNALSSVLDTIDPAGPSDERRAAIGQTYSCITTSYL